jgi:formylglycine-generating enzyme required for sulfatase activity
MGWNESWYPGNDKPVEQVTWYDGVSYCNRRSIGEGLAAAYTITRATYEGNHIISASVAWRLTANGYRLLTDAEWEYACRAGSTSAFCNGGITNIGYDCAPDPNLDLVGWNCGNASDTTHDCGGKMANAWGLKDMHGNVAEMCWDRYENFPTGPDSDPVGPSFGFYRVGRGGNWSDHARTCRSACRNNGDPGNRNRFVGLRVARNVQ